VISTESGLGWERLLGTERSERDISTLPASYQGFLFPGLVFDPKESQWRQGK